MLVAVWVLLIAVLEILFLNYETRPSAQAQPPERWPLKTAVPKSPDRPTLLMFIHPRCPCTRASLEELNLLMTRCRGKADLQVLFLKPGKFAEGWTKTDHWKEASRIPGVKIMLDRDGRESRRFGTLISGQTLLYGTDGRLLFKGGITSSRGHSGSNAGRSALEAILLKGSSNLRQTPVFGCSLRSPGRKFFKGFLSSLWKQ